MIENNCGKHRKRQSNDRLLDLALGKCDVDGAAYGDDGWRCHFVVCRAHKQMHHIYGGTTVLTPEELAKERRQFERKYRSYVGVELEEACAGIRAAVWMQ